MSKDQHPLIIQTVQGEPSDKVPVWFMRQAGRYLPEYNRIRTGLTFIELCMNPEKASEVSIQPHRRYDVDGIIMFADILTPLHGAGVPLHFEEKRGPVLEKIIQTESDLKLIDNFSPEKDTPYIKETLSLIKSYIQTTESKPALLGFAGAPFTLASYLIEGGTSRKFEKTKAFIFNQTELFHKLSNRLAEMTIDYLSYQIRAGADLVQIFDSWGGILSGKHYREFAAPYTKKIIEGVRKKTSAPITLFVGNSSHLIREMVEQNPDCISLDWRVRADEIKQTIPSHIAVQGNLDPLLLYGTKERVHDETLDVLNSFSTRGRFIFNLGHGIHPSSKLECVEEMIRTVKSYRCSV